MPLLVNGHHHSTGRCCRGLSWALANLLNRVCALWAKMALALRCRCVKAVTSLALGKNLETEFAQFAKNLAFGHGTAKSF